MEVNGYAIEPGASLVGANLSGANLANANLKGANLSGAKLWDAILKEANLTGAKLSGAEAPGANLIRDTLQRWSRLSKENWGKDLGHDQGTTIGCYKLYLLKAIDND